MCCRRIVGSATRTRSSTTDVRCALLGSRNVMSATWSSFATQRTKPGIRENRRVILCKLDSEPDFLCTSCGNFHSFQMNLYAIFIRELCNALCDTDLQIYRITDSDREGWGRGPLPSRNDDGPNP